MVQENPSLFQPVVASTTTALISGRNSGSKSCSSSSSSLMCLRFSDSNESLHQLVPTTQNDVQNNQKLPGKKLHCPVIYKENKSCCHQEGLATISTESAVSNKGGYEPFFIIVI